LAIVPEDSATEVLFIGVLYISKQTRSHTRCVTVAHDSSV